MYSIYIVYKDGRSSYLSHKNRTAWTKKTANKHFDDVIAKVQSGKWSDVKWAEIHYAWNK